jgi:hypothetical protein
MTVFVLDNGHPSYFFINEWAPVVDFSIEPVVTVNLFDDFFNTLFYEIIEAAFIL